MQIIRIIYLFLIFFKTIFCRQSICNIEDKICGNTTCYNPEKNDCLDGIICSKGQKLCNNKCYSSDIQYCINSKDICPKNEILCSNNGQSKCYNGTEFNCTSSGAICTFNEKGCGLNCYNPTIQICYDYESTHTICNKDEEYCANQCFSNSIKDGSIIKTCSFDKRALCEQNELGCGTQCYTTESIKSQCIDGILCKMNQKRCGSECFNPINEICFNNTKICRLTREPCGEYNCYSPYNETCYKNRTKYGPSSCDNTLLPCGYECYDSKLKICLESNNMDGMKFLCELGSEVCGQKCHTLPDNENKCMNGTLCKNNEQSCGEKCYNPKESGLVCHNNKMLCKIEQKSCGCGCYDPKINKCVEFPDSITTIPLPEENECIVNAE